jgi:hypothetical protein
VRILIFILAFLLFLSWILEADVSVIRSRVLPADVVYNDNAPSATFTSSVTIQAPQGLGSTYGISGGSLSATNLTNGTLPVPDSNHTLGDSILSQSGGRILTATNNANTTSEIKATNNSATGIGSIQVLGSGGDANIGGSASGDVIFGGAANVYIEQNYPTGGAAASFFTSGRAQIRDTTTFLSSATVLGANGLGVTYQISAGSFTGAGLSTCGDATHGLAWSSSNNLFSCQNITGSGGGGGGSTLEVGLGSSTFKTQISSPTATISFDQSQFGGKLLGATTAFVTLAYSTNTQSGNYTAVSTDTFIYANCSSACTITLPSPVSLLGKVYQVEQAGSGNVTVATSAGLISGGSTALLNQQWSELDLMSVGGNYVVK